MRSKYSVLGRLLLVGTMFAGVAMCLVVKGAGVRSAQEGVVAMQNAFVRAEFDKASSSIRVIDLRDGSELMTELDFWIGSPGQGAASAEVRGYTNWNRAGQELRITAKGPEALDEVLAVRLSTNGSFLELALSAMNLATNDVHIKRFGVRGVAFRGRDFPEYLTLDGESSGADSRVTSDWNRSSRNNLVATFGRKGERKRSLVIGGLGYREFARQCRITKGSAGLRFEITADDPCGKLVKAGSSYEFPDTFYIDVATDNRFDALERYGRSLAQANRVDLTVPDSPVVNLWYAMEKRFGGGPFKNNTPGAIWVIDDAQKSGFLKYGPVGVRLEPDDYAAPNNQQGWWDDAHFQRYQSGQCLPPYETLAKWGTALKERGGVPFIYCQTARRSEDYCQQFPGHMLFNDPAKPRPAPLEWFKDKCWGYDFTDPGFIQHMREVYANMRQAGVRGIKFDYPITGWANEGGFEDPMATTGSAYRNIFQLAFDGLGAGREVHERLCIGGDLTLGAITTMRIQDDTDKLYPPMVTKAGLRWYKNRVAVYYDLDAKHPAHAVPPNSIDAVRAMFTMTAVVSGRLELGKYLGEMSAEERQVISRVVPLYLGPKSARPVDAFEGAGFPQVYDLEVRPDWHQLTLYNTAIEGERWPTDWELIVHPLRGTPVTTNVTVRLGDATDDGGLGLERGARYYLFDFWNNRLIGVMSGVDSLSQQLRPGEVRMIAIHKKLDVPQFISTDRHVLQGVLDMVRCEWDGKALNGRSRVVADETYTVVIAGNGHRAKVVSVVGAEASMNGREESADLVEVKLVSQKGGEVDWRVEFE